MLHSQPVVTRGPLLLELTLEDGGDIAEPEGADRRTADRVRSRAKHSVDHRVNFIAVIALRIRFINLIPATTFVTHLY